MSKVNFTYGKDGRIRPMPLATAKVLEKMGFGSYADVGAAAGTYQTRDMRAANALPTGTVVETHIPETATTPASDNKVEIVEPIPGVQTAAHVVEPVPVSAPEATPPAPEAPADSSRTVTPEEARQRRAQLKAKGK